MFVINTDQGYLINGMPHEGLKFGIRENARKFTDAEIDSFGNYITKELEDYYMCETVELEII